MEIIGNDLLDAKEKVKNIARPTNVKIKVPKNIGGGLRGAFGTMAKSRILPKLPIRALGGAAILANGVSDAVYGFENQANRSYADIQKRGGFLSSVAKDAFPTLGKIGTAIGEGIGEFIHGPLTPLARPDTTESEKVVIAKDTSTLSGELGAPAPNVIAPAPVPAPAPVALPERVGAVSKTNDSYFINHQTGEAPGEKQYLRDLPQSFPQRDEKKIAQGSTYESPTVNQPSIPAFDMSKGNFADLLQHNLNLSGQARSRADVRALKNQGLERQRQDEVQQNFGLDQLKNNQDTGIKIARLNQESQRITDARNSNQGNLLARIRGQNMQAEGKADEALSYADQVDDNRALEELAIQRFGGAPSEFTQAVPGLVRRGVSLAQVQDAYQQVSAMQSQKTGTSVSDLDVQKLYDEVESMLGLGQ